MNIVRLGIYGGTFNPIHTGHLIIAQEIFDQFDLDQIIFVPSARPPHKSHTDVIDPEHRFQMVSLAIKDDPRFEVSDIELKRSGLSYTVDTLKELHKHYGTSCQFFFIIGADSLVDISTWRSPHEIFSLSTVVVVPRPDVDIQKAPLPWRDQAIFVKSPLTAISSTDIRQRIHSKKSIHYLVPPSVECYIHDHKLYTTEEK